MRKKIFILLLVLFIFGSLASMGLADKRVFDFDSSGTNWDGGASAGGELISTGGWVKTESTDETVYASGLDYGNDTAIDDDNVYINVGAGTFSPRYYYKNATLGTAYLTYWFYDSNDQTTQTLFGTFGETCSMGLNTGTSTTNYVAVCPGFIDTGIARTIGWHNLTAHFNYTNRTLKWFIDGTYAKASSNPAAKWTRGLNESMMYFDAAKCTGCKVDDIHFWNTTAGAAPPATPNDTINVSSTIYPSDNTQYNRFNISINTTVNATNTFQAQLWLNGILNQTRTGLPSGKNVFLEFNLSFSSTTEETYTFSMRINDSQTQENTTNQTFYIDNVLPDITWNFPLRTNRSIVSGNLSTNIGVYDPNLFSYVFNLTLSNGSLIYSVNDSSLTGNTTWNITPSIDLSMYGSRVKAGLLVCDGHTDELISFNDVRKVNNELYFEGVRVYLQNKGDTSLVDYSYKTDRYSFDFNTRTATKIRTFIVESPDYIHILDGKTKYEGHIVTGRKWVDFEMAGTTSTVQRITDNKVLVTVTSNEAINRYSFNSIGELNCVYEESWFLAINETQYYAPLVLSGATSLFQLNITYNSSYMGAVSGNLHYNGSIYAGTATDFGNIYSLSYSLPFAPPNNTNKTFHWSYSFNTSNYNTTNATQEVQIPIIDDCTVYDTNFVNYTIRDEDTSFILNGSMDYIFNYGYGTYNATFAGNESLFAPFSFCMFPSWANFTADITIDYDTYSSGYTERTYIALNYNVTNVTDFVNLYLLAGATEITIHLADGNDKDLINYLVEVYKYDVATDTDILVETERTDTNGDVVVNLKKGSTQYSFRFYDQLSVLQLQTIRFKIFSTLYEYILKGAVLSPLAEWIQADTGVSRTLTYNNNTQLVNFTYSYSGDKLDSLCLTITGNGTSWYSNCSTVLTGSMTYNITKLNISYTAVAYAVTLTGHNYNLNVLGIDTTINFVTILTAGLALFISLIVFLFLSLMGIMNKSIAIVMGMVAIILLKLFGLFPVSWVSVTGIVCVGAIILGVLNKT